MVLDVLGLLFLLYLQLEQLGLPSHLTIFSAGEINFSSNKNM